MKKEIAAYETKMGAEGKLKAALGIEEENLTVEVKASYPLQKVVEPATQAVDNLLTKLEKAIPGDWDKPIIDKFKEEYKKDLIKLIQARA